MPSEVIEKLYVRHPLAAGHPCTSACHSHLNCPRRKFFIEYAHSHDNILEMRRNRSHPDPCCRSRPGAVAPPRRVMLSMIENFISNSKPPPSRNPQLLAASTRAR